MKRLHQRLQVELRHVGEEHAPLAQHQQQPHAVHACLEDGVPLGSAEQHHLVPRGVAHALRHVLAEQRLGLLEVAHPLVIGRGAGLLQPALRVLQLLHRLQLVLLLVAVRLEVGGHAEVVQHHERVQHVGHLRRGQHAARRLGAAGALPLRCHLQQPQLAHRHRQLLQQVAQRPPQARQVRVHVRLARLGAAQKELPGGKGRQARGGAGRDVQVRLQHPQQHKVRRQQHAVVRQPRRLHVARGAAVLGAQVAHKHGEAGRLRRLLDLPARAAREVHLACHALRGHGRQHAAQPELVLLQFCHRQLQRVLHALHALLAAALLVDVLALPPHTGQQRLEVLGGGLLAREEALQVGPQVGHVQPGALHRRHVRQQALREREEGVAGGAGEVRGRELGGAAASRQLAQHVLRGRR
mmetsp:Transcript_34159/g.87347  ORF Transcript_34159/g.87347 Transcript_34159/m.87347 type:complete len:411 (+) Transcript_34159:1403-2635(+)